MAVKRTIEPPKQTTLPGIVRFVPSAANWPRTELWRASWPTSCRACGHPNRSPVAQHTYPRDESHHVSHEAIYRSLFIQARGALNKELLEHLRRTRGMRRSRHHTQKTDVHGQIVDAVSISERPASAEDRAVPGHWEGDLVFGSSPQPDRNAG